MSAQTSRRVLAGFAVLMLGSSSALAADAQAFANRLKTVADAQGMTFAFTGAESSGDNVVVKGVTLGANSGTPFDITFEKVTGSDAEGWTAARVPVADVDKTEDKSHVVLKDVVIDDFRLSGTGGSKLPGLADFFFGGASLGTLTVEENGTQVVSLAGLEMTNTENESGGLTTEADFGDLKLDFTAGEPNEGTETLKQLGYEKVAGTGSVAADWNPKTGALTLDPLSISFQNVGKLDFSYQINGYTPQFIESLRQVQKQMSEKPDAAESSGMAVMGLMSQLSLASAEISFVDDSLTGKLLDFYAKQSGQPREQLIAGLTQMLPGVLAALNNPEFQTEVTTAVETFLKDPKSLTISVAPNAPVAAAQIMGAAMGAPQTLPQVLALSVTANQPMNTEGENEGQTDDDADGDGDGQ